MKKQKTNFGPAKITFVVLVAVFTVFALVVVLSYFLVFRELREIDDGNPSLVRHEIDAAIDRLVIDALIKEYQGRHPGEHPSDQYLTENMGPHYPLFYETIRVRGEESDPGESALPEGRELHIWLGYGCSGSEADSWEEVRVSLAETDYGQLLERDPASNAEVKLSILYPNRPEVRCYAQSAE